MNRHWYTVIFVVVCAGILAFFLAAPPVKTPRIPETPDHKQHKEFARCPTCHLPGGNGPQVAADHIKNGNLLPDHMKCYMCHRLKNQ